MGVLTYKHIYFLVQISVALDKMSKRRNVREKGRARKARRVNNSSGGSGAEAACFHIALSQETRQGLPPAAYSLQGGTAS